MNCSKLELTIESKQTIVIFLNPIKFWDENAKIPVELIDENGNSIKCTAIFKSKKVETEKEFCDRCGIRCNSSTEGPCEKLTFFFRELYEEKSPNNQISICKQTTKSIKIIRH